MDQQRGHSCPYGVRNSSLSPRPKIGLARMSPSSHGAIGHARPWISCSLADNQSAAMASFLAAPLPHRQPAPVYTHQQRSHGATEVRRLGCSAGRSTDDETRRS